MAIGCLICEEQLESPAPVPAPEAQSLEVGAGAKPKKPKGGAAAKRPPPSATDNVVTPCGHLFHELCLNQWFKNKNTTTCPVCRKTFTKAKLIRVFPSSVEEDSIGPPPTSSNAPKLGSSASSPAHELTNPTKAQVPTLTSIAPSPAQAPRNGLPSQGTTGYLNAGSVNSTSVTGVFNFGKTDGQWSYQPRMQGPQGASLSNASMHQFSSSVNHASSSAYPTPNNFQHHQTGIGTHNPVANSSGPMKPSSYQSLSGNSSTAQSLPINSVQNIPYSSCSSYPSFMNMNANYFNSPQINPYMPALPSFFGSNGSTAPTSHIQTSSHALANNSAMKLTSTNGTRNAGLYGGMSSSTQSSSSAAPYPISSSSTSNGVGFGTYSSSSQLHGQSYLGSAPASIGATGGRSRTMDGDRYDELTVIHQTLVADYTELQQKYNDAKDEVQLLKAQLESSKDEIKRLVESAKRPAVPPKPTLPQVLFPSSSGPQHTNSGNSSAQKRFHDGQPSNNPGSSSSKPGAANNAVKPGANSTNQANAYASLSGLFASQCSRQFSQMYGPMNPVTLGFRPPFPLCQPSAQGLRPPAASHPVTQPAPTSTPATTAQHSRSPSTPTPVLN